MIYLLYKSFIYFNNLMENKYINIEESEKDILDEKLNKVA